MSSPLYNTCYLHVISSSPHSHAEILHLSSPSLKEKWRDDPSVVDMLEKTFDKFLDAYRRFSGGEGGGDSFPDHFHCRYLEIYEQDEHCGTHLFELKVHTGCWVGSGCSSSPFPAHENGGVGRVL